MTTEKNTRAVAIPDLFSREIRPIRDWPEWLERWQVAVTLEEMLGLLHVGFNLPLSDSEYPGDREMHLHYDRIIFYFKIADGWKGYGLSLPTDSDTKHYFRLNNNDRFGEQMSTADLRQVLATKAFDMLCLNFFRSDNRMSFKCLFGSGNSIDRFESFWSELFTHPLLFLVILNFFRADVGYRDVITIRNLNRQFPQSHNEKHAIEFLLECARFVWGWREDHYWRLTEEEKIRIRTSVEVAKPWTIEVFVEFNNFDLLDKYILDINDVCLAKLNEIALRSEFIEKFGLVDARQVVSIDEACYTGSSVAWFLKRHELKKRERARLLSLKEAEEAKREAQRLVRQVDERIKKLTPEP